MGRTLIASFLGTDRPGVMHAVADALASMECNILEMAQTILRTEFAAMVIVDAPPPLDAAGLKGELEGRLAGQSIQVSARELGQGSRALEPEAAPFVVTITGPDRLGLIARATGVFARHGVNIEHLKAISRRDPAEGVVLVFEVAAPASADQAALRRDLEEACRAMGMRVSMQHRDIFEAIHRI